MEKNTLEAGKEESNTDKEFFNLLTVINKKANGKKGEELHE